MEIAADDRATPSTKEVEIEATKSSISSILDHFLTDLLLSARHFEIFTITSMDRL